MEEIGPGRVRRRVDRLREVDDHEPALPPQEVVDREIGVDDLRPGQRGEAREQLVASGDQIGTVGPGVGEPRRGDRSLVVSVQSASDELHEEAVGRRLDRIGNARAGLPGAKEHRELVRGPAVRDDLVAVRRARGHRPLVAGVEVPAGAVDLVRAVDRALREAELAELALRGMAWPEALVGEEAAGRRVVPLDEEDLGLLAGLEDADGLVLERLVDEPIGSGARRCDGSRQWLGLLRTGAGMGAPGSRSRA